jgi:hypothetical protein
MLSLAAVRMDGFALVPLPDTTPPTVKFSGNGDTAAVAPLDRFLNELHANLTGTNCSQVHIDMVDLYFMNSSCVRTLASWIHKVKTKGAPYRVHLKMNSRQSWQRRSLEPIKRLAPTVVVLSEDEPESP